MSDIGKWRNDAVRKLAAPVERRRDLGSVIGRVEDRFEDILDARRRGMAWAQIAKAIENKDAVSIDAVESAFKRVCREKGITAAMRQRPVRKTETSANKNRARSSSEQTNLFGTQQGRWVDDGE
ncbi:hypothetical protein [Sphingopyxis sp.]|uniref:hypothetical protein n=1 Tax=Sphingopyxis sp. TaxID=1908224 RepID=UPI002D78FBE8|nr:hypothetical protein [Sphingopyxis sp.]HET6526055.1 hypothetical protein [Sphingopyxis sp.]